MKKTGRPRKTRTTPTTKRCYTCRETKPAAQFYRNQRSSDGLQSNCKPCLLEKQKAHPSRQPNHRNAKIRENKYGITMEEYDKLFARQKGKCGICRLREPLVWQHTGERRLLAVDHDHETGKVRGLLCSSCNTGLGKFKDDVQLLKRAIAWVGEVAAQESCCRR